MDPYKIIKYRRHIHAPRSFILTLVVLLLSFATARFLEHPIAPLLCLLTVAACCALRVSGTIAWDSHRAVIILDRLREADRLRRERKG